jgi:hypothetical protein
VSFVQGLINVGIDTVNSFIQLGIDEWNFWLWPLPPLPPIFPFAATEATADVTVAAVAEDPTPAAEKRIAATDGVDKKKTDVDVVKEVKAPKEPKTTSSSQPAVAAQGEIRGAHTDETTEAKKVPNGNGHKKGDNGPTAGAATESSTSAATNDDAGAKRDKKNGAAKKE